jgi:methylase of polypeptide subunit release factors
VLDPERHDGIARLRSALEAHGYVRPDAAEALGVPFGSEPRRGDLPLYLRRLLPPTPLHALVKLFALHVPVTEAEARAGLAPLSLEEAEALGLVARGPGDVRPRVGFVVTEGLVIARDQPEEGSLAMRADHVVGLNPPALLLARLTVRRRVGRVLDLGCGGGVQSLLAARHAEHVVGVDLNPRAVAFARFNARLNGVSNAEFREGDLFDPVHGERFDLMVCNPPYVVSPETQLLFRDGGRPGDSLCAEIVRRAGDHLEEGGFATVLVNWVVAAGEPWSAPLRRWVAGTGCDAWLAHLDTQDVLTYAAGWNREGDAVRYAAALDRWLSYYAERGIGSVGMGAVVLRRRAGGPSWVRADELPERPRGDASREILRFFTAEDRLLELEDEQAFLDEVFAVGEEVRVEQVAAVREGRFEASRSEVRREGALPMSGAADAGTLRLLQLCDGRRTLREAVTGLAVPGSVEGAQVVATAVAAARRLAALGFLVPAGKAGEGRTGDGDRDEAETSNAAAAGAGRRRGRAGAGGGPSSGVGLG